ncbi:MAG: YeaC family protein [Aestuariibacter sp.]
MRPEQMIQAMTPEVYERLRTAVETGKWPDGTLLDEQQKETSLQAVMMYQAKVLKSSEHMTVNEHGEVVHRSKQELRRALSEQNEIARFKQNDI